MIEQALKEWDINPKLSIMIGDKPSDIEAALAAGLSKTILFQGEFPQLAD